jgi:hypothetical protein
MNIHGPVRSRPRSTVIWIGLTCSGAVVIGVTPVLAPRAHRRPVAQQLREATPEGTGHGFLVHDHDATYGPAFARVLAASGRPTD